MSKEDRLPDTMTIPEFAERTQISLTKAYQLARKNELPVPVIRIGGSIRIRRDAYERWFAQFEGEAPKAPHERTPGGS